jgi:hypothetical protein
VLDDARNGRCYLPAGGWRRRDPPRHHRPGPSPALAAWWALLQEADRYYQSAATGLQSPAFVPAGRRTALASTGHRIFVRGGGHAWDTRVVGARRLLYLAVASGHAGGDLGPLAPAAARGDLYGAGPRDGDRA